MSMLPKEEETKSTLVFVMFYILGTVSHMPQSFYVTANDYWMYKFRDPDEATLQNNTSDVAAKTDLQTKFTAYYSIVSNISMVTGLVATVFLIIKFSIQGRIVSTLSSLLGLLIITIIFVWVDTDSWQTAFFIVSLIIGVLLNGLGACFLLSLFHLAMKFPPVYIGALLSGQSICGIISTLIQIFTLATGLSSKMNATLYFVIGVLFIAIVETVFLAVLVRKSYYQYRLNKKDDRKSLKYDRFSIFRIIKKIWVLLATMVLTAGSGVVLYPGVTTLVESTDKGYGRWGDTFFVPVCTFLTYNVIDFIGRECSFRFNWIQNQYAMLAIAVLRLGFIPAIIFCNVQPRNHLPVIFGEDWQYIIWISVFSFTNGYLMNLSIVRMPSICNEQEMNIASVLIVLVMVGSIAICSVLGPVLIALV